MAQYSINNIPGTINTECGADRTRRILQNCKNLLMCRMGEIPYDRMRGLNPAIFHLPLPIVNEKILPEVDRILAWEPRAVAVKASAERDNNGDTIITVVVDIKNEGA